MAPAENSKVQKVCVLVSGGIDSTLLLAEALKQGLNIYPLYVAVGFTWEQAELFWLRRLLKSLSQEDLQPLQVLKTELREFFPQHWAFTGQDTPDSRSPDEKVELPARNFFLLSQAVLFCQARYIPEIWIGTLANNPFSDATPEFFQIFETAANLGVRFPIRIRAPFSHLKKTSLIKRFPDFNYSLVFSCLRPRKMEHCEDCNKCEERRGFLSIENQASIL